MSITLEKDFYSGFLNYGFASLASSSGPTQKSFRTMNMAMYCNMSFVGI